MKSGYINIFPNLFIVKFKILHKIPSLKIKKKIKCGRRVLIWKVKGRGLNSQRELDSCWATVFSVCMLYLFLLHYCCYISIWLCTSHYLWCNQHLWYRRMFDIRWSWPYLAKKSWNIVFGKFERPAVKCMIVFTVKLCSCLSLIQFSLSCNTHFILKSYLGLLLIRTVPQITSLWNTTMIKCI